MPKNRSLSEILKEIHKHYLDNPKHGIGCACLDKYQREISHQLQLSSEDRTEWKASAAMSSLLRRASQ